MEYQTPKSKCLLCGSEFTTIGIRKHISACLKKQSEIRKNRLTKKYICLSVQAIDDKDYFLFLLVSDSATLDDLDNFLRKIWLECCGHLSAFSIEKWGEELLMTEKIKSVASTVSSLNYAYDFGSTTELIINFMGDYSCPVDDHATIKIISRNSQPIVPCDKCGEFPAVKICSECQCDGGGWLCAKCARHHECGEDGFLPVVNSPRAGVCGYCGEEDEQPIPPHVQNLMNAKRKAKITKIN